jgi:hypothetical protein
MEGSTSSDNNPPDDGTQWVRGPTVAHPLHPVNRSGQRLARRWFG